ncbi:10557_t:CDS:1, partial [Funneliformis geosporum]
FGLNGSRGFTVSEVENILLVFHYRTFSILFAGLTDDATGSIYVKSSIHDGE